jgi:hypothetical protein
VICDRKADHTKEVTGLWLGQRLSQLITPVARPAPVYLR